MAKSNRASRKLDRKISSSALRAMDEFANLKEVHEAFACLGGLLSPNYRPDVYEEFSIEPAELRALTRVLNSEMQNRSETVDEALQILHKALLAKIKRKREPVFEPSDQDA